jgi:hypothetical protein
MRLVTFNSFVLSHVTGNVRLRCVSGIASANRSSFPMLLPTTTFTTSWSIQVKSELIYLLREYSPCWCNISELATAMIPPTGSGRAIVVDIVVHSRYAVCNNNIGAEVTWCDIKKSCDSLGTLGAFIGTLCRWIATAMGEENMKRKTTRW